MVDHLLVGAPVPVQPESVLFGFSLFFPSRNLSTWIQFCSICFCFWIPRICLVGASFGIQPECGPVFKTEICRCRVLGLRSRWVLPSGRNLQCSQAGGTASLSFSIYLTFSLSLSLSLSIYLSLSHTHTHSIYLSRSMPACLSACLSLSVARARALSPTYSLSLSLALTHSLTLSLRPDSVGAARLPDRSTHDTLDPKPGGGFQEEWEAKQATLLARSSNHSTYKTAKARF